MPLVTLSLSRARKKAARPWGKILKAGLETLGALRGRSALLRRRRFCDAVLLKLRSQLGLRDRTDHRVDQLAVLEEQNGRDGAHIEPHRGLLIRIDIQLRDLRLPNVLDGQLNKTRSARATRSAPPRPKTKHHQAVVFLDLVF